MKQWKQNSNKLFIIGILFILGFTFIPQGIVSAAPNYSALQAQTTQAAQKRKRAIYPAKYGLANDTAGVKTSSDIEKKEKPKTFFQLLGNVVRALVLAIAVFLGLAAFIAKNKEKFKQIKLPNALKNVPVNEQPQTKKQAPKKELDPRDKEIQRLVFKFFEINK